MILADLAKTEDVGRITPKIVQALSDPVVLNGREFFVTASIGISIFPTDGDTIDTLLKNADTAMYHAKELGRNNVQYYSPAMNLKAMERLYLENSLRRALERGEFVLHYQPIIDLVTDRPVSAEALIRWNSPDWGLVSPAQFIPLAEETGLIVPIGEWVLRTGCAQNEAWRKQGLPPIRIGVNLSARQFTQPDLVKTILTIIQETGIEPYRLALELTESVLMNREESLTADMLQVTQMGVALMIDDFGTGYSSLGYLKRFPATTLKIDRTFIRDLTTDADDAAIVAGIITLAHSLEMKVVAEGVETAEQLAILKSLRCDQAQGFLFSKPLPAEEFESFMRNHPTLAPPTSH